MWGGEVEIKEKENLVISRGWNTNFFQNHAKGTKIRNTIWEIPKLDGSKETTSKK